MLAVLLFTVSVSDPELALKLVSPLYAAAMLSLPVARVVVVQVAAPPLKATVVHPEIVVPFEAKDTVPVGVPVAGAAGETDAVKVTD